jgi:hypothetical protein
MVGRQLTPRNSLGLTLYDRIDLSAHVIPVIGAFSQNVGGAWQSIKPNLIDSY